MRMTGSLSGNSIGSIDVYGRKVYAENPSEKSSMKKYGRMMVEFDVAFLEIVRPVQNRGTAVA